MIITQGTQSTEKMIKEKYEKQLKEIKLLDDLMLDYDYEFYRNIKIERVENIYNEILSNYFQLGAILQTELSMNMVEYNDLEKYEKESVHEDILNTIDNVILEIVGYQ